MDLHSEKQRILIVDDSRESIQLLADALGPGYQISVAANGEDALQLVVSGKTPDLILIDIMMPETDGYEVCRRLKTDERTSQIPIILIAAKNRAEDEMRGLEMGAADYITKPYSIPIVRARINTHLELKKSRDILENMVHLDGLTSVRNRRFFDDALNMEWRRANRRNTPLSLIMIDIDHFKSFNDYYGLIIGDDCLKQVAQALADSVRRPADFVARYGGEEFATLLPETELQAAQLMAELMRKRVESLEIQHGNNPHGIVTISLGVATVSPLRDQSMGLIIKASEKMLKKAKEHGRNRVESVQIDPEAPVFK